MKLNALSIGYNNSAPILKDIDAELIVGQLVALVGRNGTGKSTLLRTMARLQTPLSGSIEGDTPAIVLTSTPDLRNTTVRQMVAYGRLRFTGFFGRLHDEDIASADRAIARLGIEHLSERMFCDLSDGEKQKVMIARALTQDTSTLLLDEPSAFLDYPSRQQLMQQLQELAHHDQRSIVVSTHDLELAQRFADQLWVIRDGKLTIGIKPEDVDVSQLLG